MWGPLREYTELSTTELVPSLNGMKTVVMIRQLSLTEYLRGTHMQMAARPHDNPWARPLLPPVCIDGHCVESSSNIHLAEGLGVQNLDSKAADPADPRAISRKALRGAGKAGAFQDCLPDAHLALWRTPGKRREQSEPGVQYLKSHSPVKRVPG